METAKVHMVYGASGAGKTTFAIKLAIQINGVHFSIDRWMQDLFGDDVPDPLTYEWIRERVSRCEERIWATAKELVPLGVSPVLDLGFMKRADRERFTAYVQDAGFELEQHYLSASRELRRSRVMTRNEQQGETYSVTMTPEMFEFAEGLFEPPTPAEQKLATHHES